MQFHQEEEEDTRTYRPVGSVSTQSPSDASLLKENPSSNIIIQFILTNPSSSQSKSKTRSLSKSPIDSSPRNQTNRFRKRLRRNRERIERRPQTEPAFDEDSFKQTQIHNPTFHKSKTTPHPSTKLKTQIRKTISFNKKTKKERKPKTQIQVPENPIKRNSKNTRAQINWQRNKNQTKRVPAKYPKSPIRKMRREEKEFVAVLVGVQKRREERKSRVKRTLEWKVVLLKESSAFGKASENEIAVLSAYLQ